MSLKILAEMIEILLPQVDDDNILKQPMKDWVDRVKEDDTLVPQFMASTVAAFEVSGVAPPDQTQAKLAELKMVGIYGAWEKPGLRKILYGKSKEFDEWIDSEFAKPGDVVFTPTQLEWMTLLNVETVGGVQ